MGRKCVGNSDGYSSHRLTQNQVSSRKCWFESDRGHHLLNISRFAFYALLGDRVLFAQADSASRTTLSAAASDRSGRRVTPPIVATLLASCPLRTTQQGGVQRREPDECGRPAEGSQQQQRAAPFENHVCPDTRDRSHHGREIDHL